MSIEMNTATVRRYIEEWANAGNEAALHAVIAADWVSHGTRSATAVPTGLPSGTAGAKQLHDEVRAIWLDDRGHLRGRGPDRSANDEPGDPLRDVPRHSRHGEASHVRRDLDLSPR